MFLSLKIDQYLKFLIKKINILAEFEKLNEIEEIIVKQQTIQRKITDKIFNNTIAGQTIEIVNENFNLQLNKISKVNSKDLYILNEDLFDFKLNKYRKMNIRKLQRENNINNCEETMIFCLPSYIINNILNIRNSENLGFNSLLNKNKNLGIKTNETRTIFSENSLDFELKLEDSSYNNKYRNLQTEDLNIYYNIRLNTPNLKNLSSEIIDTLCVQYDRDNKERPNVSCASWYDYVRSEVVCECQKQGLTVNLIDVALSRIGILQQFSLTAIKFRNIFSLFLESYF